MNNEKFPIGRRIEIPLYSGPDKFMAGIYESGMRYLIRKGEAIGDNVKTRYDVIVEGVIQ